MDTLADLVAVSRRYGSDSDFVLAGGGNTSFKTPGILYIKGSGTFLASIDAAGFVRMDRRRLDAMWTADYPEAPEARESAVLADLMAARLPGEEGKRPSVETLLHDMLPGAYVVHTHPAVVNGITCGRDGAAVAKELFGDDVLWVPSTNPGYVLSRRVRDAFTKHRESTGRSPDFILLQNHGIFVHGDDVAGIDRIYDRVLRALDSRILHRPVRGSCTTIPPELASFAADLGAVAGEDGAPVAVAFSDSPESGRFIRDAASFAVLTTPFTPDHIVYAGSVPLFVESPGDLETRWRRFVAERKRRPRIVALRGKGVFGVGTSSRVAELAIMLFEDAMLVAVYAETFGGPRSMTTGKISFIDSWEVENYRSNVSSGTS